MEYSIDHHAFEKAWTAVRRRVALVRLCHYLRASYGILFAIAIAAVFLLRSGFAWRSGEWMVVAGLVGVWLAAGLARSCLALPSRLESLVLLDQSGNWKDRFSSAWEFACKTDRTPEEDVHVAQSLPRLGEAVETFPRFCAVPSLRAVAIGVLLTIAFAFTPWGRSVPEPGDLVLTPGMREVAAVEAEALRKNVERVDGMDSLSEEESADLEKLRVEVESVANSLAEAEGLTAGEMLEALEGRARAAERLAERLGLADDAWASPEMLAEMAEHPDTVDLAVTIRDQAASAAEEEAMELFRILDHDEIREETSDRLTLTLEQIMAAATENDRGLPVGERFGNASGKLSGGQPKTAAREFEELAKHFRLIASRKQAEEKLEQLAEALREAGSEISGSDLEQMETIAGSEAEKRAAPAGLDEIGAGELPEDLQRMLAPQLGQSGAGETPSPPGSQGQSESSEQSVPVPGMAQGDAPPPAGEEGGEPMALTAPVPGESPPPGPAGQNGQGMGASNQAQDGQGEGGLLSAPIPGAETPEAGESSTGMSLAGSPGSAQGQGGDQAGTGTAPMVDSESQAMKATQDGEVVAQINADGASSVRAIEGQARAEEATRSRQEIVTEFLSAEEQALDGKALPQSRREHIIRYFSAIRRQFEDVETSP